MIFMSLSFQAVQGLARPLEYLHENMDVNIRLFPDRLRRFLVGEEVTLPDAAREHVQSLLKETRFICSFLRLYEGFIDMIPVRLVYGDDITANDLFFYSGYN